MSGVLNLGPRRDRAAVSLKKLTSLLIFAILLLSVFAYIILYKP